LINGNYHKGDRNIAFFVFVMSYKPAVGNNASQSTGFTGCQKGLARTIKGDVISSETQCSGEPKLNEVKSLNFVIKHPARWAPPLEEGNITPIYRRVVEIECLFIKIAT